MSMEDYVVGAFVCSPYGDGFTAAAAGKFASENPYPVDSSAWSEWMRGHDASQNVKWTTVPFVTIPFNRKPN